LIMVVSFVLLGVALPALRARASAPATRFAGRSCCFFEVEGVARKASG
jgi:hypothetical protein